MHAIYMDMGHGLAGSDIYRRVRLHQCVCVCVHKQYTFLMAFRVTQYARNASVFEHRWDENKGKGRDVRRSRWRRIQPNAKYILFLLVY